jgi:hypothetical protein
MYEPEVPSLDRLPTELRDQIWEYALGLDNLNPRTIELIVSRKVEITQRLDGHSVQARYTYSSPQSNSISTVTRQLISSHLRTINHRSNV